MTPLRQLAVASQNLAPQLTNLVEQLLVRVVVQVVAEARHRLIPRRLAVPDGHRVVPGRSGNAPELALGAAADVDVVVREGLEVVEACPCGRSRTCVRPTASGSAGSDGATSFGK